MNNLEDIDSFENDLNELLDKAKREYNITDATLAWVLLREGTNYYFKTICHSSPDNAQD